MLAMRLMKAYYIGVRGWKAGGGRGVGVGGGGQQGVPAGAGLPAIAPSGLLHDAAALQWAPP